jgi:hypothetical protein
MLDKEGSPLHTGGEAKSCGKKTTGSSLEVENDESAMVNEQWSIEKGGAYGYLMDCQYQYVPADPSDHHGFLSYHPDERIDPVAEKRMTFWSI